MTKYPTRTSRVMNLAGKATSRAGTAGRTVATSSQMRFVEQYQCGLDDGGVAVVCSATKSTETET